MWCHHCESDVAVQVEAGERRARCANCGTQIAARGTPAHAARTREALQLLERWSRPQLLDPFQTTPAEHDEAASDTAASIPNEDDTMADAHEFDETESVSDPASDESVESHDGTALEESIPLHAAYGLGLAESPATRDSSLVEPSTSVAAQPASPRVPTTRTAASPVRDEVREASARDDGADWVATAGQLLAYAGVAVLTVGTTLALWGHFGNHPDQVPTGWLVAAAGQMLLFLGIVTLVSSGVEENAGALQRRFDRVVDRLERVEDELARSRESPDQRPSSSRDRLAA